MKNTGFRIDSKKLVAGLVKVGQIKAAAFKPDLLNFVRVSLNEAVRKTPARDLATIKRNQKKQYLNRISFIWSSHTLEDPTLISKDTGQWLYFDGTWWRPDLWTLPPEVYSIYQMLLAEQLRRLAKSEEEFIAERTPARFLYKKSWIQCGESIGLKINAPDAVKNAHTRRDPPEEPARGYAQIRGGDKVISVVIYNPFVDDDSKYRTFDGEDIIEQSLDAHRSNFNAQVNRRLQRTVYAILHS